MAFAISATVIGMIIYLSLYVQNTLGYSPVQAGLRFLPLSLASFAVALLTGRLIGTVAMRVLLGVAMAAAAAGLASMAHLTATSTWLVLLPGLILAGIGLGITSTGLASAALAAVEPARAGMAAGLVNTLRQVGTATGVAVLGALYASRVTTATLHALAGLPAPPGAARLLAAAVASGAGTRVAAAVPPAARAAVTHAARAGTASGLNDVLLAAAAFAALGAIAGFAFGPDPARQPTSRPRPRRTVRPAGLRPAPGPATGQARNNGTITSSRRQRDQLARLREHSTSHLGSSGRRHDEHRSDRRHRPCRQPDRPRPARARRCGRRAGPRPRQGPRPSGSSWRASPVPGYQRGQLSCSSRASGRSSPARTTTRPAPSARSPAAPRARWPSSSTSIARNSPDARVSPSAALLAVAQLMVTGHSAPPGLVPRCRLEGRTGRATRNCPAGGRL